MRKKNNPKPTIKGGDESNEVSYFKKEQAPRPSRNWMEP